MGLAFEEYRRAFDLTPYPRPALVTGEEEKMERCDRILKFLLRERGMIAAFSSTYARKRAVIRDYMNTRNPLPVPPDILADQDALFWTESVERGIVRTDDIPEIKYNIAHWQGISPASMRTPSSMRGIRRFWAAFSRAQLHR